LTHSVSGFTRVLKDDSISTDYLYKVREAAFPERDNLNPETKPARDLFEEQCVG